MCINSVTLTRSELAQVHVCCGITVTCSPLHNHRGLCTEGQPFCMCSVSHTLSCTCKKPAQGSCELPQVAWSSKLCTVLLQSMTNPSWLVEGALVLAAVSDPISTLIHCPLDMFLQSCLRWRDELHIVVPCEEFPPGLVNVCAFAGSVIQQDHEPLDDAHSNVWYVTQCKGPQ